MSDANEQADPRSLSDPGQWVEAYGDYLYRHALFRLRDSERAQDMVQETLLAALRARDRFAGRSSERTWLLGILKHKIIDHLRVQYRERPISEFQEDEGDQTDEELFNRFGHWKSGVHIGAWQADPAKLLEQKDFWRTLEQCLRAMPPRMAEAFTLRTLEEMNTDEVCNILRVTATNLNVMLFRARNRLRRCLEINWFQTATQPGDRR